MEPAAVPPEVKPMAARRAGVRATVTTSAGPEHEALSLMRVGIYVLNVFYTLHARLFTLSFPE